MFNFTYTKPYYTEDEILDLFNLTRSSLQRMREECLKNGENLFDDMGYFHIRGIKKAMYEPYKFSSWLIDNRIVSEGKFDYEVAEVNKVKEGLINLATTNKPKLKEVLNDK